MMLSDQSYGNLTQRERVGLLLGATSRDDRPERTRLWVTSRRVVLQAPDTVLTHAFDTLSWMGAATSLMLEGPLECAVQAARLLAATPLCPEEFDRIDGLTQPSMVGRAVRHGAKRVLPIELRPSSEGIAAPPSSFDADPDEPLYGEEVMAGAEQGVERLLSFVLVDEYRKVLSILEGIAGWCELVGIDADDFRSCWCSSVYVRLDEIRSAVEKADARIRSDILDRNANDKAPLDFELPNADPALVEEATSWLYPQCPDLGLNDRVDDLNGRR
jgi:hypothetical protein